MSVLDRIKKRRFYKAEINGETIYLSSPTLGQLRSMSELEKSEEEGTIRTGLMIGWCLREDDEKPAFTRQDGESLQDFGKRVYEELIAADVPPETLREILETVGKLGSVDVEELRKNSPETATTSSQGS